MRSRWEENNFLPLRGVDTVRLDVYYAKGEDVMANANFALIIYADLRILSTDDSVFLFLISFPLQNVIAASYTSCTMK